ncbi:hypothetical protein F0A17_07975 [Billgrantia pellis]|uniref:AtuA-like ferredoxin-fold domain-containing protein n=1 Tax=Billgrantia pellis TaxID=2606936 RepID=A0A7V7KGZ9_9GAMM|nr:hypothetical protein [Halomonas pellis]KAA0012862.1 hypothetical protein F0A17_07975 [Halomonas pellis]
MNNDVTLLHRYAHARAGDKGDRLNLAVFAHDTRHYAWLLEQLSEARVMTLFHHRGVTAVRRYPMPNLGGVNLVLDDVLQGGVNGALNLDGHGKTLSALLLSLPVTPPPGVA